MTVARNTVEIGAPPSRIYAFAAATERWPEILPHYRYVRVLADDGRTRTVAMSAWRDVFAVRWTARQTNDPATPHIAFHHVRGWTRGMDVEWIFEARGASTRVTIEHRLAFAFPVASAWLGEHVVCGYFIDGIARKTLARIKQLAEASV